MMSAGMRLPVDPAAAVRAGADLREARERLGLSLDEVASGLRIRLQYLEALEDGRISLLPGNAYALAFVRTYATALGLDPEQMVRRFRMEAAAFDRRTELDFPVPMPRRGLPAGAVMLLGVVLAVGAYVGWYRLSGEGRLPAETVAAVPERLASLAEQALPVKPGPASPAAAPRIVLADPGPATMLADPGSPDMPADPAPPVMAISPTSAAAAQLPSRAVEPDGARLAGSAAGLDGGRVVIRANADAWIMVKDRSGVILLNRIMKAGETWAAPPRADLMLTTGNAGGTDILVDGAITLGLGGSGTVRRDLPLDPEQIRDGRFGGAGVPQVAPTRARQ